MKRIQLLGAALMALVLSLGITAAFAVPAAAASFAVSAAGEVVPVPTFEIPVVPTVILLVLQFVSPYIVSFFAAFTWSPNAKKIAAAVVSFVASAAVLVVSLLVGWIPQDFSALGIVNLVLLGLGVQQAAYSLFFKESADAVSRNFGIGKLQR